MYRLLRVSRMLATRIAPLIAAVVAVAIALPAFAATDPDGAYRGNLVGSPSTKVRHKVTNNGKFIRRWHSVMGATCGLSVGITTVNLGVIRIRANNTFRGRYHPNDRIDLKYRGVQVGRRASGHVEGSNAGCYVDFDWKTRHR